MNFAPTEQPFESTDTGQWQAEKRAFQQVVFTLNQVAEELKQKDLSLTQKDVELAQNKSEIAFLKLQIETLRRLKFSRSSERFDPAQQQMFEEDTSVDIADVEAQIEAAIAPSPRAAAVRAKPVRKPLPAHLPRVIRRLPAPCDCAECGGVLHHVRDEVSEKLDVKPAEFFVVHTLRPVMGCRRCDKVITTPTQPEIIDGGIPTPGLLAHVLISKYVDHVPLYRQRDIARRSEIDLPISTTSEWVGHCGTALKPLATLMQKILLDSSVIHVDEIPVQMLDPGSGKTKRAYLFAYRSGDIGAPPTVLFEFSTSRSGANARRFLAGYTGALVVDDYAGYKEIFKTTPMRELACWAHARRKFFELHAANKSVMAAEALTRIAQIYEVEREAKEMDATARYAHRQLHAKPKIDALFAWLVGLRQGMSKNSGAANATDYLLRRRASYERYLDDGRYPIDNNPVENAVRPIALGRKNWLFAGSERAGQRAAVIMSLVATAKANQVEPFAYLKEVLTRLPTLKDKDIATLLAQHYADNRADIDAGVAGNVE